MQGKLWLILYHRVPVVNGLPYRETGLLSTIWFGSSPPPPVSKLERRHTGRLRKRDNLLTGEGGGWGGVKSYERAWSSITHWILCDPISCTSGNCLSFSVFLRVAGRTTDRRGGKGRGQIIRRRESLVLYSPLTAVWFYLLQLWLWEGVLLPQGFHRACQSSHRGKTLSGGTKYSKFEKIGLRICIP